MSSLIRGTAQIIIIITNPATPIAFFSKTPAPITVSVTPPSAFPIPGIASDAFRNTDLFSWSTTGTMRPWIVWKPITADRRLFNNQLIIGNKRFEKWDQRWNR